MKQHHFLLSAVALWVLVTTVSVDALPSDVTSSQSFLDAGASRFPPETLYDGGPKQWSFGVIYQDQKRDITYDNYSNLKDQINVQHILGFVGYDPIPWLTVVAAAGQSKAEDGDTKESGDSGGEWLVGMQFRMMDYLFTTERPFMCRMETDVYYNSVNSETDTTELEWNELFASFTVSLTTKLAKPLFGKYVGFYFGPAYSDITGTVSERSRSYDIQGDKSTGLIGGFIYNPSDYLSWKLEMQEFERSSIGLSLGLHF